ncbi:hypothetical protein MNBD_GAMMA01-1398 [hydrothermal vent metagenome]|uniref:Uncharacterized protein n=1 Tax=hydrothermal vent metagenome TaxID=652676 RepID=A0A3B0WDH2_9ZZZZ
MAGNQLFKTIEKAREHAESKNTTFETGNYPDLLIGNKIAYYSIPYMNIRNRICFNENLIFQGDGYSFTIEGDNMILLIRLINLHRLAEIIEGESYCFESQDIFIKSITVQPIESEKEQV